MRLINCYIENFGKLHAFSYDFSEGLNVFHENNGWGKTTLAVFLKAMFYGLEKGGTRASKDLKERNHYIPWQGGVCGGNLTFEYHGIRYRIERTFKEKEKEDTCTIYYEESGLICDEFSSVVGESIFKLDRSSFERSIFITAESEPDGGYLTDNVNAKLNNLAENSDDISNYENANRRLSDAKKELLKTEKDKRLRLITLKDQLHICEQQAAVIYVRRGQIDELMKQKNDFEQQRKELSREQKTASDYEKVVLYKQFRQKEELAEKAFVEKKNTFTKEVPTTDDLTKEAGCLNKLKVLEQELGKCAFTEEEDRYYSELSGRFGIKLPTKQELEEIQEKIKKYGELSFRQANSKTDTGEREELELLKTLFYEGVPTKEQLSDCYSKIKELTQISFSEIDTSTELEVLCKQDSLRDLEEKEKKGKGRKRKFALLACACMLVISAVALMLFLPKLLFLSIGILAAGVTLLVIGIVIPSKAVKSEVINDSTSQRKKELQQKLDILKERSRIITVELRSFLGKYSGMEESIDFSRELTLLENKVNTYIRISTKEETAARVYKAVTEEMRVLQETICNFFSDYKITVSDNASMGRLHQNFIYEINKYDEMKKRKDRYLALVNEYDSEKLNSLTFVKRFVCDGEVIDQELLADMGRRVQALFSAEELKKKTHEDAEDYFHQNEEVLQTEAVEPKHSLNELCVMSEEISETIETITARIANYERETNDYSIVVDQKPEILNEMEVIEEDLRLIQDKTECLTKTIQFLSEAKERLSMRYLAGMKRSFQRYMQEIIGEEETRYRLNVDLNTNIDAYGQSFKSDYLSTGYREFIHVCTQLALVEAMFEEESPFIILDDPFTGMDSDKMKRAVNLINEVAKEHQIIYFVCHESRKA